MVISGLLATGWYWHQQTQVIVTPVVELGYSTPPNMLVGKRTPTRFERLSPVLNIPAIRTSSVALAFDHVFSATKDVVPAVLVIDEQEVIIGPAVNPAIATAAIEPLPTESVALLESTPKAEHLALVELSPPTSPLAVAAATPERVGTATADHVASAPSVLPVFKLDSFLAPAPDRMIYHDKAKVDDLSHEVTAVFVIEAGTKLILDGCNFPGGVIVKVTDLENAEDWKITRVELKGGTKIGGGEKGVAKNLGLVAPDCDLEYSYAGGAFAAQTDIAGFTAVNKLRRTHQIQMKGMVLVRNQERKVWESAIDADPKISNNLPEGIVYLLPDTAWDLLDVK